jgi:hypothetical protein
MAFLLTELAALYVVTPVSECLEEYDKSIGNNYLASSALGRNRPTNLPTLDCITKTTARKRKHHNEKCY